MGDHQRGFVLRHAGEFGLDGPFVGRVQGTGGFVKNQDGWVFEQGACNGHALLFATRELEPALAHHGVVTGRRAGNKGVNVRSARGGLHLGQAAAGPAVGNVVLHGVVEQHRVLRHDANGRAQAGLGQGANVLARHRNTAVLDVIETVQEARQRGLARARGPDHGYGFAGWNLKADVVQDGARRVVGKAHMLKAHAGARRALGQLQRVGVGRVSDLLLALQQGEHFFQIRQVLLELAVNRAQKIERNVDLDHEGVDHHQVTQRHAAIDHALGGAPKHGHQAAGDDELLARVQNAQGALAFEGGLAVAFQVVVVAQGLKLFVVEVFDRLKIEQRINGAGVGLGIELVHALAKLGAPLGHGDGEADVQHQGNHRNAGKPDVKLDRQEREHQPQLNQRGNDAVERIRHQRMHRPRAALDVARHAAGLAVQVKAQAHGVQMAKHPQRDAARSTLGGFGKHQVA